MLSLQIASTVPWCEESILVILIRIKRPREIAEAIRRASGALRALVGEA
jgi:hypothetical protein